MDFKAKQPIFKSLRDGMASEVKRCQQITGVKRDKTNPVNHKLWRVLYADHLSKLEELAKSELWSSDQVLDGRLRLFYCALVVNLETRNSVVAYDYMDFARRIGEVWESFCKICWEAPANKALKRLTSPTFAKVKAELLAAFAKLVNEGHPSNSDDLIREYTRIVEILGNINLKEDEYCSEGDRRIVIDFKSGFGSNEKGNTERLLTVAKIFGVLPEKHECVLVVRAAEGDGNNYLQFLKSSGLWKVYCGKDAYKFIQSVTGFDLASWIHANVDFKKDMETSAYTHLLDSELTKYLAW
jgi:hypothetical protein